MRSSTALLWRLDSVSFARIPLTAAQLGSGETTDVVVLVDKTFVPASVPQLKSLDPRELGVRVFHTFVEPKQ
jgi:hypothetical protein